MAVGKGSMERAAKAAGTDTAKKPADKAARNTKGRKAVESKAALAEKPDVKTPVTEKEAAGQIVYQKSSGMLERAAEPNEQFGLGDAMPVYYF